MISHSSRRHFLISGLALLGPACRKQPTPLVAQQRLAELERTLRGRVGVFAVDTASGREVAHRADERFAMCSTFKWVLAAAVLARAERGVLSLQQRISYGPADLLEYAPITREHVGDGFMTLEALARAAVTVSDNTAANLLLAVVGGPAGLTEFIRTLGDHVTRLDRNEPTLNSNEPGDARDTTSPRAMVGLMRKLLCDRALSNAKRAPLLEWLRACETGKRRLRSGFPNGWSVGDKTGSGAHNAINDVAIAEPPGRAPVLVAVYLSESSATMEQLEAAHARVARLVAQEFAA